MAIQTATTGQLANAQAIVIAETLFTMEHNAPCKNTFTPFTLGKGEKQITVPKVGQMTATDLTDGIDITSSEAIGMTSTDLTTAEVGLKVILTDKLIRQEKPDVLRMVGRQMGDAMARKVDTDCIALFDGLSNAYGASAAKLNFRSFVANIAILKTLKAPRPYACVLHPYVIYWLSRDVAKVGSYPMPHGFSEELLKDFWAMTLDHVAVIDDGNISSGAGSKGAMYSKAAFAYIQSQTPSVEQERDASLRATEVVMVSDYGAFELDDGYGVEMQYTASIPSTTST
ncbi:hypothetical protein LCGC14_0396710 [marine sediment metagenome]|uniref:Uncharacterized protein n=1 Tax=marine sediment metagenome TaxID=412755 RepID=A0A0F9T3Y0_9ZZZZ